MSYVVITFRGPFEVRQENSGGLTPYHIVNICTGDMVPGTQTASRECAVREAERLNAERLAPLY